MEDEVNSRKNKIMVVGKREGGMSWKIGEEIMEEVKEFKYLGVWFDKKLLGNPHLVKIENKAGWKGDVMSKVNGQVEVDRERMVWELIRRPSWSMQHKCGGQEGVMHAGSWSWHR